MALTNVRSPPASHGSPKARNTVMSELVLLSGWTVRHASHRHCPWASKLSPNMLIVPLSSAHGAGEE
jgi:uncharacterized phage-associated protein